MEDLQCYHRVKMGQRQFSHCLEIHSVQFNLLFKKILETN